MCYFEPNGISTVPENISYLQALSDFPIRVLNLCEDRSDGGFLKLNPFTRLDDYDAVVIHNTIAYNPDNLESLDTTISPDFGEYEGVKVIFKQDENYRARSTASFIGSRQFDLVFSCLPEEEIAKVYPPALAGTPRFVRMLTGYVTQNLRELAFDGARPRPIDIGYRGSIQPLSFGKLSYEKRRIGDDVAARASKIGLVTDISSLWEDRFSGSAWLEFLGRCKATLGVESGASIFDLDDTLEERCTRLERELSKLRHNGSFDEEFLSRLKDLEGNVYYNQISPRHFEAAATRTLQVLFPGKYSGILAAGKHYVALERDYGNFDEIADFILDPKRRKEIVDRTFLEIVQNRAYWIETFVERFDSAVSGCLHDKGRAQAPVFAITQPHHNILLIAAHDPYLDPRLEWIEYHAPNGMCIHQLGVSTKEAKEPSYRTGKNGGAEIVVPRADHAENFEWLVESLRCSPANVGAAELNSLYCLLGLPETHLNFWLGVIRGSERIKLFRWYLKYFLDINATLIRYASAMRGIDGIIATDLLTLPAALVLKQRFDAPVFYDAHE
ncbi:MAG TPA: hypothetical protein VFH31_15745 [Pyrinomonadaceae bacterium]|nr:hypothetical protein [Pyrinomonadaceae bacterium]